MDGDVTKCVADMTEACRAHLEHLLWIVALGWSLILLIAYVCVFLDTANLPAYGMNITIATKTQN